MTYDVLSPASARLWPYQPDWRNGFDYTREYLTTIGEARDGTEQRHAEREVPRITAEYRSTVKDVDLAGADHFMRVWQNKPTLIPHYGQWARLTGGSSAGATTLTLASPPAWAAAGQLLVLCGAVMEVVLVDGVAGSTITLDAPLANAWASGAVIRPSIHGLFDGRIKASRFHAGAGEYDVTINAYPGGTPPLAAGTAWATLGIREIFTPTPNWAGRPSVGYLWEVEQVDYDKGRTAQFRPIDQGQRAVEADFAGLGVTTAGQVEQFFDRMKGRRGAFYLPTWEQDYELAATVTSGQSYFDVPGTTLASDLGATDFAAVEEGVAVFLRNGTRLYRRITDIAASGGNSRVTVNAAWGTGFSAATIGRISRLLLCRFASDKLTTSWRTPQAADFRLSFQGIRA